MAAAPMISVGLIRALCTFTLGMGLMMAVSETGRILGWDIP